MTNYQMTVKVKGRSLTTEKFMSVLFEECVVTHKDFVKCAEKCLKGHVEKCGKLKKTKRPQNMVKNNLVSKNASL